MLEQIIADILLQELTLRIGKYQITVSEVTGAPVKLTPAIAIAAVTMALTGHTGTLQSGNVSISIGEVS